MAFQISYTLMTLLCENKDKTNTNKNAYSVMPKIQGSCIHQVHAIGDIEKNAEVDTTDQNDVKVIKLLFHSKNLP